MTSTLVVPVPLPVLAPIPVPRLRLALAPPPAGSSGEWVSADDGERTVSRFLDAQGVVRGFGLSLHTPALRQALLAELDK